MKKFRYECVLCKRLHEYFDDAAECCVGVEEVEVDEDCECESREECTKGCFDPFPQFPRGDLKPAEYVKQYEQLNHLKGTP